MTEETTEEYVDRYLKKYKGFKPVYCPALNDTVYFTSEGFNHLLFKRGHRRNDNEIHYRLPLINLIVPALKNCTAASKALVLEEFSKGVKTNVMYFEISHTVGRKCPAKVKVIVRRRGVLGQLAFHSVMKQKTPHKER